MSRRRGGHEAAMRRAIAAFAWLPDEDVEVPSAPDLEAPPVAAGEMVASPVADAASVAAAAGAGGAAAPAAPESMGVSPASDCARVIPFEDALSMHDAMEFHLGGRH